MAVKKKFPYRAAVVACNGGCRSAEGEAGCADGCIGCKACIDKCKFGAISINEYGVAEVDEEKCIGCGACAKVCPQKVIHVHECANYIVVKCSNKKKGAEAKKQCNVSCIGCGICEKTCTAGAIKVKDNCAESMLVTQLKEQLRTLQISVHSSIWAELTDFFTSPKCPGAE